MTTLLRKSAKQCCCFVSALDVARTITELAGRAVVAHEVPRSEWHDMLHPAGLGEPHTRLIIDLYDAHNAGRVDIEAGVNERRVGVTSLAQEMAAVLSRMAASGTKAAAATPDRCPRYKVGDIACLAVLCCAFPVSRTRLRAALAERRMRANALHAQRRFQCDFRDAWDGAHCAICSTPFPIATTISGLF